MTQKTSIKTIPYVIAADLCRYLATVWVNTFRRCFYKLLKPISFFLLARFLL